MYKLKNNKMNICLPTTKFREWNIISNFKVALWSFPFQFQSSFPWPSPQLPEFYPLLSVIVLPYESLLNTVLNIARFWMEL